MLVWLQLEEQKIELEGTKARLRMTNSRNAAAVAAAAAGSPAPGPVVVSVQTRTASAQTESTAQVPSGAALSAGNLSAIPRWTQTDTVDQVLSFHPFQIRTN